MATRHRPRALLFDVFGTCVDWRASVVDELFTQAHVALNSATASLATSVRMKATDMTLEDWEAFAQQWRDSYKRFTKSLAADPSLPWKSVDEHHLEALEQLVAAWGLDGLWSGEELHTLSMAWHRLKPWSDTATGVGELNEQSLSTVTLSNGNLTLLSDLKAHGSIPFTHVFSAEHFGSYKPSPSVYLGAVERLGLEPHDCAMVAAHLGDLKAAKSHGLQAFYIERAREEDWSAEEVEKARKEGWVDIWVSLDQNGFISLAEKLRTDSRGALP